MTCLSFIRVSNCVGYRNYRYFYGFLFWATVGTLYVSVLSGYMIITPGSLLFPVEGGPSIVTRLFGTREHNVYAVLYDTLSGISEKNAQLKSSRHNKSLRGDSASARRLLDEPLTGQLLSTSNHTPVLEASAYVGLNSLSTQGRYLSDSGPKTAFGGTADVFRGLQNIASLDWVAHQDMLLFMAFMLATGVWIGTGTMLAMHTFLGKLTMHCVLF